MINPWQSTQFGYFPNGNMESVLSMRETNWYKNDNFGLKTLDERGAIVMCEYMINHTVVPRDRTTYEQCIRPYLNVSI